MPQMVKLAPFVHIAVIGDDVIVLDVAADRYRRLGASLSHALIQALCEGTAPDRDCCRALIRDGVLADDGAGRPLAAASLTRPAADIGPSVAEPGPITAVHTAAWLFRAQLELNGWGLAGALERARRRAKRQARGRGDAVAFAQSFAAARRLLPFASRCLRDSLALHALLSARSISCTLAIGVTARPFAAHCWVQAEDTVLSGSVDNVAPFTPILVL
jgi:hypothetical protein